MSMDANDTMSRSALPPRSLHIVCTIAIGVALVGYFVGQGGNRTRPDVDRSAPVPIGTAQPALSYTELRSRSLSPNRDFTSDLARLASRPVADTLRTDLAARLQSLADRALRRSYNGAPPVIPHPVDTTSPAACLACHGDGLRVGERSASRIPHDRFLSCLQCHAESRTGVPGGDIPPPTSTFVGLPAPQSGARAYQGAPPQMPHTSWMRGTCLACHGPTGMPGMLTSHPERQNCRQCHASSATLDQAIVGSGPLFHSANEDAP